MERPRLRRRREDRMQEGAGLALLDAIFYQDGPAPTPNTWTLIKLGWDSGKERKKWDEGDAVARKPVPPNNWKSRMTRRHLSA